MSIPAATAAPAVPAGEHSRVHTREQFSFLAHADVGRLFPLLGAQGERAWAPGWEPGFVWPGSPADREGMVFQVARSEGTATWVNTVFDASAGRVQYVYVIPEVVVTVITLSLHAQGVATEVTVRYERTSLSSRADAAVRQMAEQDRTAGPEWAGQINAYLARSP